MTRKTLKTMTSITGSELTLGKLIWSIRMCDEKTQVAFAQELGMSRQQLCDIEHDRKTISPRLAASYAKTLGYSKSQFVRLSLQSLVDRAELDYSVELVAQH
jgi:DNA-binding XRE family transcriptional regulator